jgi:hypothetical protein
MGQERELGCTGVKEIKRGERSWAARWLIRPEEKGEGRRDGPRAAYGGAARAAVGRAGIWAKLGHGVRKKRGGLG